MKTFFSKKYYEDNKDMLFEKYRRYCDYEDDVRLIVKKYDELPDEIREAVMKIAIPEAVRMVVETATEELKKKSAMINRIRSGKACLPYTDRAQEAREWCEMQERFEFSCYMLSLFKAKYNVA